jgi:hypothetical protein
MSRDRRRSPRIEILGRLHGHIATLDVPVNVLEMSLGGLSMETSFPFPSGAVHEFRLTLGDGSFVLLQGRIVHSRPKTAADGSSLFVTGVQFVDEDEDAPEGDLSVETVVQKLQ